jgi:hypothetical protein
LWDDQDRSQTFLALADLAHTDPVLTLRRNVSFDRGVFVGRVHLVSRDGHTDIAHKPAGPPADLPVE